MPATTTVLYEKGTDFNMDYYLKTHMPLVQEKWGSYGLKSWKVIQFGDDSPYAVQATIEWGSLDDFKKAAGSASTKDVMDDVKNFSNTSPKLFSGEVVGSK
ncbi:hypothetical protein Q7P35_000659 [Cladosporium inversicolor]